MSSTTAIQLTEHQAQGFSSVAEDTLHISNRQQRDYIVGGHADGDQDALQASHDVDSTVPDGGYGWVIVASGAILLWWSVGSTYSWGVMQTALVEDGLASPAVLSFVGSLQAALISALAIANAQLIRWAGVRTTSLIAAAFLGGSELLASFTVENVGGLFFTSGVLMGIGVR